METLKRIVLKFTEMLDWMQCLKKRIMVRIGYIKTDSGKKFVPKLKKKTIRMLMVKGKILLRGRTVKMLLKMLTSLEANLLMARNVLEKSLMSYQESISKISLLSG